VSETIKVTKNTKETLFKIASHLQARKGRRVNLDETINYLVDLKDKRPDLLTQVFGSIPELTIQELYTERKIDERRTERRHGL
jgi:hypothetical protein